MSRCREDHSCTDLEQNKYTQFISAYNFKAEIQFQDWIFASIFVRLVTEIENHAAD